jgi:hypothetical protein
MTSEFGATDEATYYTLLLMPPNGDIAQPFGYTSTEIYDFWVANHESTPLLAEHSPAELTQAQVDAAILLGSRRALYTIVFADEANSRYIFNNVTRQIPVDANRFLLAIGVFDKEIAAAAAECRVANSTYAPSPALASSVQPPTRLFPGTIYCVNPTIETGCPTSAQVDVVATSLALDTGNTCNVESL